MRQKTWLAIITILLMLTAVSACAESETWYVQATTSDRVHLREEADASARSLGLYFQGTPVVSHSPYFHTEWAYVTIGAQSGNIHRECLTKNAPQSLQPLLHVSNQQSSWVHLRAEPTTRSASLGQYDNGTEVTLLGETADHWCWVRAGNLTGYMMSSMLSPAQEERQTSRLTEIVGRTSDGRHIHAYQAENGQTLYFSAMEEELNLLYEDVNFDGHTDLVFFTSMGASNAYCEFFVWTDGQYVMAEHPGFDHGLCNYRLHPEKGRNMVSTHANNGSAGAEHEDCVFRWEGMQLVPIRRAVGELRTERVSSMETTTLTTWHNQLHITIWDYTDDRYEGTVIYEKTADLNEEIGRELEIEGQKLWEGI